MSKTGTIEARAEDALLAMEGNVQQMLIGDTSPMLTG